MPSYKDQAKLLFNLLSPESTPNMPFIVTVDATTRCNLNCLGCKYHSPLMTAGSGKVEPAAQDLDVAMFRDVCASMAGLSGREIAFSGEGEPLLHPRLPELIAIAHGFGCKTMVFSNGTLLDEPMAEKLACSGLDELRVSFWAASEAAFAANYPGRDLRVFRRMVDGLRIMQSVKKRTNSTRPMLIAHQPVNRHNCNEVDKLADLAIDTGCDAVSFAPFYEWRGKLYSESMTVEDAAALKSRMKALQTRLRSAGLGDNIDLFLLRLAKDGDSWKITPCYMPWVHARVKMDGSVLVCNNCDHSLGNLNGQSLREIYRGEGFRAFRRACMSSRGGEAIRESCDCRYCCYLNVNLTVHRRFRHFRPLAERLAKRGDVA